MYIRNGEPDDLSTSTDLLVRPRQGRNFIEESGMIGAMSVGPEVPFAFPIQEYLVTVVAESQNFTLSRQMWRHQWSMIF